MGMIKVVVFVVGVMFVVMMWDFFKKLMSGLGWMLVIILLIISLGLIEFVYIYLVVIIIVFMVVVWILLKWKGKKGESVEYK